MVINQNFGMRFLNSRWMLPRELCHLSVFGRTRSGKSQTLLSVAQRAYFYGAKILDLYDAGAMENCYWSLKSNHPFWNNKEFHYGRQTLKAQEFPINCVIPMSKDIPSKLPDIFTPFTIPISELTENDLKAMLGNTLTRSEITLWRTIIDKINSKTTLTDLLNYIAESKEAVEKSFGIKGQGISTIYNMFTTFQRHKLFSSKVNSLSLNLRDELRNKKVVTSLVLKHFPRELWGFIINHFIYKTFELVVNREIKHPVIIIIREAGDFLVSMGLSSPQEEAIRYNFTDILRKGGKHQLYFYIDNQSPLNIDVVKTQFAIKICHYVDNTLELQQALGDLGSMLLTKNDYNTLRTFQPGRCFVLENKGLFCPQMMPPLTMMSGQEGVDFYDIWLKERGQRFKNINNEINIIEEEYTKSEQHWKDLVIEKIEKTRIEKELKEEKKKQKLDEEELEKELKRIERDNLRMQERETKFVDKLKTKRKKHKIVEDDFSQEEVENEIEDEIEEKTEEIEDFKESNEIEDSKEFDENTVESLESNEIIVEEVTQKPLNAIIIEDNDNINKNPSTLIDEITLI